jgi:hypothetical protein
MRFWRGGKEVSKALVFANATKLTVTTQDHQKPLALIAFMQFFSNTKFHKANSSSNVFHRCTWKNSPITDHILMGP